MGVKGGHYRSRRRTKVGKGELTLWVCQLFSKLIVAGWHIAKYVFPDLLSLISPGFGQEKFTFHKIYKLDTN